MQPKSVSAGFETTGQGRILAGACGNLFAQIRDESQKAAPSPAETLCSLTLSLHGKRYAITHEATLSSTARWTTGWDAVLAGLRGAPMQSLGPLILPPAHLHSIWNQISSGAPLACVGKPSANNGGEVLWNGPPLPPAS